MFYRTKNNMEPLLARILIKHVKGATIAYLYNRESFDLLNIERKVYDNSQFISIGDTIIWDNEKYTVKELNFKLEDKTFEVDNRYGVNMYSPTDISNFNCQIGVFVE